MNRRAYLGTLAAGASLLAGCGSPEANVGSPAPSPTPAGNDESAADGTVPLSQLRRGAPRDFIPAITQPAFAPDWSGVDRRLLPTDRVIGVERDGEARAYPLRILLQHEVVNDDLGGPILVTYCPLCRSGMAARRRVRDEPTRFGVSGLLWLENLVLYDALTESLWSQLEARAIRGPETGTHLQQLPTTFTSWERWRASYPDSQVLLPPPASLTVDGAEAFGTYPPYTQQEYKTGSRFPVDGDFEGLHPKELVVGIEHDGTARAYSYGIVVDRRVVNDTVGGLPVVIAASPDATMTAFVRRVDGAVLRFAPTAEEAMVGGGSVWEPLTGRAVAGPHEGTRLAPATDLGAMFWSNWNLFHPDTTIYGD